MQLGNISLYNDSQINCIKKKLVCDGFTQFATHLEEVVLFFRQDERFNSSDRVVFSEKLKLIKGRNNYIEIDYDYFYYKYVEKNESWNTIFLRFFFRKIKAKKQC